MKSALSEGKFIGYTLLAVSGLVLIHVFHSQLISIYNPINYLGIHTILEFFSIAVSFCIFLYGWKVFADTKSRKLLLVSLLFLVVGLIDLLHTLSFKGMPFFITESSIAKATSFWVIARMLQAIMMLVILVLPERELKSDPRSKLLGMSLFLVSAIGFLVFYFETSLPVLVIEGQGTTLLKNTIEYFISFLHITAVGMALVIYNERKNQELLYMALAFTFLFLSELIFTIYQSVYDIDNFTGHLYKVIGYYFILKGFYYSFEKNGLANRFERNKDARMVELLQQYQGMIFTVRKESNVFAIENCIGELVNELSWDTKEVVGKTIQEISPTMAPVLVDNFQKTWELGTNITFRVALNKKFYVVSLDPLFEENQVMELLGTMIDITRMKGDEFPIKRYAQSWS